MLPAIPPARAISSSAWRCGPSPAIANFNEPSLAIASARSSSSRFFSLAKRPTAEQETLAGTNAQTRAQVFVALTGGEMRDVDSARHDFHAHRNAELFQPLAPSPASARPPRRRDSQRFA